MNNPMQIDLGKYKTRPSSTTQETNSIIKESKKSNEQYEEDRKSREILAEKKKLERSDIPVIYKTGNYDYIDLYEDIRLDPVSAKQEQKRELYEGRKNRPAMFNIEPSERMTPLEEETISQQKKNNESTKNKSTVQLEKMFRLDDTHGDVVRETNYKMFEDLQERVEEQQLKFNAFLIKSFNILNYKRMKCMESCCREEREERSFGSRVTCLNRCNVGIFQAQNFAKGLETGLQDDLEQCLKVESNLKEAKDPLLGFFKCHEKLITDMQETEILITQEFSNYIYI